MISASRLAAVTLATVMCWTVPASAQQPPPPQPYPAQQPYPASSRIRSSLLRP